MAGEATFEDTIYSQCAWNIAGNQRRLTALKPGEKLLQPAVVTVLRPGPTWTGRTVVTGGTASWHEYQTYTRRP